MSIQRRNHSDAQANLRELIAPLIGKEVSEQVILKFGSLRDVFLATDEELLEKIPKLDGENIKRLRAAFKLRTALNGAVPEYDAIRKPEQAIDYLISQKLTLDKNTMQAIILDTDLGIIETQPLRLDAKWVFEEDLEKAVEGMWNYKPKSGDSTHVIVIRGVESSDPSPDEEDHEYFEFFDSEQDTISDIHLTDYITVSINDGVIGNRFYSFSRNGQGSLSRVYQTAHETAEQQDHFLFEYGPASKGQKPVERPAPGAEFI